MVMYDLLIMKKKIKVIVMGYKYCLGVFSDFVIYFHPIYKPYWVEIEAQVNAWILSED